MKNFLTPLATTALLCLTVGPAQADGIDKLYDYRGGYMGELSIVDDVSLEGETLVLFELADLQMQFYVPPEAAYVMIDAANPIIANSQVFQGGWTSTAAPGNERWSACPGEPVYDHNGVPRQVYGDMTWTYLYLDGYDLYFNIELGHCDGPVEEWAFNNPALERPPEVPAMDVCGNEPDTARRALGCSKVIANPASPIADVTWAFWSRAYVRCGSAPVEDIIADAMSAARLDPNQWQEYFQRIGKYNGPIDGQINDQLYKAASTWAHQGCR